MKMNRKLFERQKEKYPDYNLCSIGKDKYLHIKSCKHCFKSLIEVLECIVALPIGLIWGELEFLWECILKIPMWFKELCESISNVFPILYIKIIDEENVIKAKFKDIEEDKDGSQRISK